MSSPIRINATGQILTGEAFIEKATVEGTAASILRIYDGTSANGRLIATLACAATSSNTDPYINTPIRTGIYATLTATGSGWGVGLVYCR